MPSFFSNRRLIILLVSLITVVAVIGITMKDRPQPTVAEQYIRDSVGFVQSVAYQPARIVAGFFEDLIEMRQMYSENKRLKANLYENARLVAKIRELEEENHTLKEQIDAVSDLSHYQLRSAQVVMRSPDRWYQQVTINRGKKHGIQPDMSVITHQGLVGRVKSIAQFTSVVELLTDVNRSNHVSAIVQGNDLIYGVIEGYDVEQEALLFQMIPNDAPLEKGQMVITSGLGGLFPRGLLIGEVSEVIPDQNGLSQTALVKPAGNMYQLDHVLVVERSFIPQEDLPSLDQMVEENGDEEEQKEGTEE